jgi:hypothetical protein
MVKDSKKKNVRYGAAAFFKKVIIYGTKTFVMVFNGMTSVLHVLAEICQGD